MGPIYRDPGDGLRRLRAELFEKRWQELEALSPELRRIYTRRIARTVAGVVGFAGMALVFLFAILSIPGSPFFVDQHYERPLAAATIAVWAIIGIAYVVARVAAAVHFPRRVLAMLEPSGELHRDVSDLASATMSQRVAHWIGRYERTSAAWPLAGAAMVLPLLLHWLVYALHSGGVPSASGFGFWIVLSAVTVAHCHLVLAFCGWRFARDLTASEADPLGRLDSRGLRALGVTAASSTVPGLVLAGIPCLLVVVTGLVFVPASFWTVATRVRRERSLLAQLSG
jgi:hypothetical protein